MAAKKTILCVDDEEGIVEALYDTFMDTGFKVKTALGGEEALEIFDREDIALVISDQRMPGMEGTELLAKINSRKPYCKKILLTGYADINATVDAINKGSVDRYFSKPWDDDELIEAVKHLMKMYDFDAMMNRALSDRKGIDARLNAFASFLDSMEKGVCVLDNDGGIQHMNRRGLELLKQDDASSLQGEHIRKILGNEIGAGKGTVRQALTFRPEGGAAVNVEAVLYFDDASQLRGIEFDKP